METSLPLPSVPDELRTIVMVQQGAEGLEVTVPTTETANPNVQKYLALLMNQEKRPLKLTPCEPDEFLLKLPAIAHHNFSGKIGHSEVQTRVLNMFREGQKVNASDIHMTVRKKDTLIEMRINGELYPIQTMTRNEGMSWLATIYQSMCDLSDNMFKDYMPQDGRLKQEFLEAVQLFGARYAHINTPSGVFSVMRLIPDERRAPPSFEGQGFMPAQIVLIEELLRSPQGIIINCGPTGSGKSTAVRSSIHYWLKRNKGRRRLITQEDPVEGEVEGAIHTSVTADRSSEDDIELAWLRGRRALLRLDLDAAFIGEIRDVDSAMAAINLAESGHTVFSTQHANSPLGNLNRLQIIGVRQGFLLSSRLFVGFIAQRLLPVLCPHCALSLKSVSLEVGQQNFINEWFSSEEQEIVKICNEDGCEHCIRTVMGTPTSHGLAGRTVAAEVMRTSPAILRAYHHDGEDAARELWLSQGGISISKHARYHVLAGRVDPFMADSIVPFRDLNEESINGR